jgi:DNA-binding response OmpR family regulator
VRARSDAPVIAINDLRMLDETLDLFSSGVDDVVCKPIHVREILARVRAIQARSRQRSPSKETADIVFFSDGRDPLVAGQVLALPRRELRILECLAKNRSAWVSKRQIFNQVYGIFNDDVDENVIESHVSRLRKRLRQCLGRDPIETQRFLGYRLAERVAGEAVSPENHAASFAQAVRGEFVA